MTEDGHEEFNPPVPIGHLDQVTPSEIRARRLIAARSGSDEPILALLEREIETLIEHLEELRELHRDLDQDLVRAEARAHTELLRLRPLRYALNEAHEAQRDSFKRRLEELARERRSVSMDLFARRRALLDRLASLLERHAQVRGSAGEPAERPGEAHDGGEDTDADGV